MTRAEDLGYRVPLQGGAMNQNRRDVLKAGSLALLGTGILGLGGVLRRKIKA